MSYGYCRCGAKIKRRTRGIPSIDTCENGHQHDARLTLRYDPTPQADLSPFGFPLNSIVFIPTEKDEHKYTNDNPLPEAKFVSPEPQPTGYEAELLDLIIEECAEVIQRVTKMKRFGVKEIQPGQDFTNAERLSHELGDLSAVVQRAIDADLVCEDSINEQIPLKHAKLDKFLQNEKDAA
ncbi:hypothetical protein PXK56_17840 [Phaeobacter gallaeciensis]|uniref:hypothetical protein n=1 Tax=Phaeobacter gallaeciensis TaxID=60890 RepID=UPI0023809539|nr:hypothetical protein [Phaeobacter gallaeciensis]MDE4297051.1 hypothetical protein [Phaeobacter gallaeciensis]